jgi:hypothetical protein
MTRSFAPTERQQPDAAASAPLAFPFWPYAYLAYAEHCSRDYARYLDQLGHAPVPQDAARIEQDYRLHLLSDMNRAFYNLIWVPFGAALAVAAAGGDGPTLRMADREPGEGVAGGVR